MEMKIKESLKIICILLFLILSCLIAFANSAPVLTSVVGGAKEKEPLSSNLVGYWDMDDWNENICTKKIKNAY